MVHGDVRMDGSERTGLHEGQQQRGHPGTRVLSRQDTLDSETQGSRDSAYTEAGDSCMDIETDPYEEPEPRTQGHGGGHGRLQPQGSWEELGPDQENLQQQQQRRRRESPRPVPGKGREPCWQHEGGNKNQLDSWGRDVCIR
ncbi:hypothetical protein FKM82_017295 [Ascaphus truei]